MTKSDAPDFATLDALLDEALGLDEQALSEFLAALPEAQREALVRLLDAAGSDVLSQIQAAVRGTIEGEASPEPAEPTGTAGPWRLRREIGSGGTGQVFYAERVGDDAGEHSAFEQKAAVKILWSHRIGSQFSDRFFRERRILASIDHPGLARFLDGGLLGDNRPWFAMEFIEGEDIVSACRDRPLAERLRLLLDVCDTIDYAHRRLIVHRDLKPGNVLVDSAGRPRVLDFGIARILGDTEEPALTRAGGTPLTLQYASPEQVAGGNVDVASDIYQLGVLAYEMLAGRVPYEISEHSLHDSVRTITDTVPPPASRYNAAIDRDLDAILARALEKAPSRRYPSAAAFAGDIRNYLADRPVSARPHTAWYLAGRFLRRHAVLASIITVSVLGLAFATLFSVDQARDARAEAERTRATQEILADVFQQADPFGEGGSEVTLAEALIRARPSIAEKVADDPLLAYQVHKTLADIFESLDMLDYEIEAYEAAWQAAKTLGRGHEAQALTAVAGIGNAMTRTDPAAAAAFLDAQVAKEPPNAEAALEWLSAEYAEANALLRLRDYESMDALAYRMDEVAKHYGVEEPRTRGRISQFLAGASRRAGDLPAADGHWQDAVDYMREAGQPAGHAVFLSNQAIHYGMTGRYEQSEAAFKEAVAVFREHDPENTSLANILRSYSGLQFRMGEPESALSTLDESLAILDPERDHYSWVVAQDNAATYAFASGHFDAAFDALESGLSVAVREFGADDGVTARLRPVFARWLLFGGKDEAALAVIGESGIDCSDPAALYQAVDAALATQRPPVADRESMKAELERVSGAGSLDGESLNALVTQYQSLGNVFLDPLDRWQFLSAIAALAEAHGFELPKPVALELSRFGTMRDEMRGQVLLPNLERAQALIRLLEPGEAQARCAEG